LRRNRAVAETVPASAACAITDICASSQDLTFII
jgi:hypothetical protein